MKKLLLLTAILGMVLSTEKASSSSMVVTWKDGSRTVTYIVKERTEKRGSVEFIEMRDHSRRTSWFWSSMEPGTVEVCVTTEKRGADISRCDDVQLQEEMADYIKHGQKLLEK